MREADALVDGIARAHWVLMFGPGGDDEEAAEFWGEAPSWIASGIDVDAAIATLVARST